MNASSGKDIDQQPVSKRFERVPETVYIGLGGNIGDVETAMHTALEKLDSHPEISVLAKSALYKTPPWGDEDQDWFLNACAQLQTLLPPLALLDVLKEVETALMREETRRWGPRTIDLDILLFGQDGFQYERLEIPHPRMKDRGFVLLPLLDLNEGISIDNYPLSHWLNKLDTSDIERVKSSEEW